MDAGDEIDLDVTGVAHGGVFVGRHPSTGSGSGTGRVVFVPDAIPGERVRVRLTAAGERDSFWRGETVEVLDSSSDRRPHVWPEADLSAPAATRPGGADFGHIRDERQRLLKAEVLRDALVRIGRQDPALAPEVERIGEGLHWRTRLGLHVADDGTVGPYAARSHRVVPVTRHPLATDAVGAAASALRGERPGRVDLVQPADGRVRVLRRPGRATRARGDETIVEQVAGREFRLDAGGFWQVHPAAAQTLSHAVGEALAGRVDPRARHLDLYGGVGLFAAALESLGASPARITTVEADAAATRHATANVPGVEAVTARVDRFLAGAAPGSIAGGVAVLDPPRAGAGGQVVDALSALDPAAIVYVACDPAALARDLAGFARRGYSARRIRAFDLFPNSHHVEAVALLTRDPAGT